MYFISFADAVDAVDRSIVRCSGTQQILAIFRQPWFLFTVIFVFFIDVHEFAMAHFFGHFDDRENYAFYLSFRQVFIVSSLVASRMFDIVGLWWVINISKIINHEFFL